MMDFICAPSESNLTMLAEMVSKLGLGRGYILESGRSYHYYGFRLLTLTEWEKFLGQCLLMYGFADDRYIGHQLVDGHCVLRLSSGALKNFTPRLVAKVS